MDFILAPEAVTLTAVRIVHGRPITYITGEQGRPAIERALSEACALGHLAAPENQHHGTIPPWPPKVDEHHGVLDILDAEGLLVQDFPLPTEAGPDKISRKGATARSGRPTTTSHSPPTSER